MVEVEFNYQQRKTILQANLNDSFQKLINHFITKTRLNPNDIYFLSNGKKINKNETINNLMNESEKQTKKLIILVYNINTIINSNNTNIIKSNDIICPECRESCKYEIKNYTIKLYDCKNGHIIENIKLKDFNKSQNVDISKIKCDICKNKNKSNTFDNKFYLCYECKINLCPLCKSIHDPIHSIIDYDSKNYLCHEHNDFLVKYCEDCKIDICLTCVNEHRYHKLVSYEDKLINIKKLRKKMNDLKSIIDIFKKNLEDMIIKMRNIIENMNLFYNINNNILHNYEINKKRNYNLLSILNHINDSIENEINKIKSNYNYGYNLNEMLYLYGEMNNRNKEIEMSYVPKKENKEKVRIFGNRFISKNMNKCKIIYYNKEFELKEYFNDIYPNYDNKTPFKFKLKGINNITDISHIFNGCYSLYYLPDISNWNTSNIYDMSFMFSSCYSLISLPDLSKWNTSNVTSMRQMFYGCNLLKSLPDISKLNTSNVNDMSSMFEGCIKLLSLPDISKWNIDNVLNMICMFDKCNLLKSLPDISKWNTSNVKYFDYLFCKCKSLISLPDLSKWNTSNAVLMSGMFKECKSLLSLPDISKWNTSNVMDMSSLFEGCNLLLSLPDISKWNTSFVQSMSFMFFGCNKLSSLPNLSKWNTFNIKYMNFMFLGCNGNLNIPFKFKKE